VGRREGNENPQEDACRAAYHPQHLMLFHESSMDSSTPAADAYCTACTIS
jgi:hypothetical protein